MWPFVGGMYLVLMAGDSLLYWAGYIDSISGLRTSPQASVSFLGTSWWHIRIH